MYNLPTQNNVDGFTIEGMTNKYEFDAERLNKRMRDRRVDVGTLAYLTKQKGRAVSTDMIYKLQKNERPNVSAEILAALADALECSVEYLVGRTDKAAPISKQDIPADFLMLWNIYERLDDFQRFQLITQARLIDDDLQSIVYDASIEMIYRQLAKAATKEGMEQAVAALETARAAARNRDWGTVTRFLSDYRHLIEDERKQTENN